MTWANINHMGPYATSREPKHLDVSSTAPSTSWKQPRKSQTALLLRGADGGDRLAGVRRMSRLGSVSALECLNVRNENGSPVSSGTTTNIALGEIGHAVCGTALPIPGKVWDRLLGQTGKFPY